MQMANYIISYNPYQNVANIRKNGVDLKKNGKLCSGINGKRLQNWFDEDRAWPGFGNAIDIDNNESECNIEFVGREIDYVDLKDFFENTYCSDKNTVFHLNHQFLSNDEDMLDKLSNLVLEMKNKDLFEIQQIEAIEKRIRQLRGDPFVISVLATMSSGKSTLLNALMHSEILPTGDPATTAKIIEIYDNDKQTISYEAYDNDGKLVCEGQDVVLKDFVEINSNASVDTIRIYHDIPEVDTNKIQLVLRDTPGPDSTDDSRHRQLAEKIINDVESMSTIIYVMDATKLRTESDKELLENIAYVMKKGGKQANDRFLFVINRVDVWILNEKQTLEKLLEDTKAYLSQFEINSPRIFPVTAGLACDIYKCRSGYKFDPIKWFNVKSNIDIFNMDLPKVKFDEHASVSQSVMKQLDADLCKAIELGDKYEIAMIHSGIKGLEYSIREYVEKYAYPIKVSDAVQDIVDTIDEKRMRGKFKAAIYDDRRKVESIREKIKEIEEEKEKRENSKKEFEKEIESYQFSDSIRIDARKEVNKKFGGLVDDSLDKLPGFEKLKKTDAEAIVLQLETSVTGIERELDGKIKKMVNEDVYQKGNEILEKYNEYINKIEAGMNIPDFNFKEVKELKKLNFENLKKAAREVTSLRDITKHREEQIPNPDRHWWTFWKPKTVTKTWEEKVGEIAYVDKDAVRGAIIGIRTNALKNVEEIMVEAKSYVEEFKNIFREHLDKFSQSIEKIVEELNEILQEENIAQIDGAKHRNQLKELDECLVRIKNITDIN